MKRICQNCRHFVPGCGGGGTHLAPNGRCRLTWRWMIALTEVCSRHGLEQLLVEPSRALMVIQPSTEETNLNALEKFRGWQMASLTVEVGPKRTIRSITYRLSAEHYVIIKAHNNELVVSVQDHRPKPPHADV